MPNLIEDNQQLFPPSSEGEPQDGTADVPPIGMPDHDNYGKTVNYDEDGDLGNEGEPVGEPVADPVSDLNKKLEEMRDEIKALRAGTQSAVWDQPASQQPQQPSAPVPAMISPPQPFIPEDIGPRPVETDFEDNEEGFKEAERSWNQKLEVQMSLQKQHENMQKQMFNQQLASRIAAIRQQGQMAHGPQFNKRFDYLWSRTVADESLREIMSGILYAENAPDMVQMLTENKNTIDQMRGKHASQVFFELARAAGAKNSDQRPTRTPPAPGRQQSPGSKSGMSAGTKTKNPYEEMSIGQLSQHLTKQGVF